MCVPARNPATVGSMSHRPCWPRWMYWHSLVFFFFLARLFANHRIVIRRTELRPEAFVCFVFHLNNRSTYRMWKQGQQQNKIEFTRERERKIVLYFLLCVYTSSCYLNRLKPSATPCRLETVLYVVVPSILVFPIENSMINSIGNPRVKSSLWRKSFLW